MGLDEQDMMPVLGNDALVLRTAPDGSFWAGWTVQHDVNDSRCQGVSRFDGRSWTRYLAGHVHQAL